MQTIYLDISNKGVIPTIYAKQGDVGRTFSIILTDAGVPYNVPSGAAFSAWYSGKSGSGNYTDIGADSAFSVNGNSVTVEMISQMLQIPGDGILCIVLSKSNGDQIGIWNIPYVCEEVPGLHSEEATQYYTAFSEAVRNLPYPDTTLSVANKAADAAAVGAALAQKAPAGYGLGEVYCSTITDLNDFTLKNGTYNVNTTTANRPGDLSNALLYVFSYYSDKVYVLYEKVSRGGMLKRIISNNAPLTDWEWVNPPMTIGVEYRTTERWNGKPVYKQTISLGKLPESTTKFENLLIADEVVDFTFTTTDTATEKFIHNNKVTALGRAWQSQYIYATIELNTVLAQYYGYLTISYTKP